MRSDKKKFSCNVVTYKQLPHINSRKRQSIVNELNKSRRIKFRVRSVEIKSVKYKSIGLFDNCNDNICNINKNTK